MNVPTMNPTLATVAMDAMTSALEDLIGDDGGGSWATLDTTTTVVMNLGYVIPAAGEN